MDDSRAVKAVIISQFIVSLQNRPKKRVYFKYSIYHKASKEMTTQIKTQINSSKQYVGKEQKIPIVSDLQALNEGSSLCIRLYQKRTICKDDITPCTVEIPFKNIWDHLTTTHNTNPRPYLEVSFEPSQDQIKIWLDVTMDHIKAAQAGIVAAKQRLDGIRSVLDRMGQGKEYVELMKDLGTAISELSPISKAVASSVNFLYKQMAGKDQIRDNMLDMLGRMESLAEFIAPVQEMTQLEVLKQTMGTFPEIMSKMVDFVEKWLEDPAKVLHVNSDLGRINDMKSDVDLFKERFSLGFMIDLASTFSKSVDGKELREKLLRDVNPDPSPRASECMKGTRLQLLEDIHAKIYDLEGENMIWIKGHPGAGKSAIASSLLSRLGLSVFYFRFDRNIAAATPNALWRGIAFKLSCRYLSVRKRISRILKDEGMNPASQSIEAIFTSFVKEPLLESTDIPANRPLIFIIDAVDECGSLSGAEADDRRALLATLKVWPDLPKHFKMIVTSRPELDISNAISSISSHTVEVPTGNATDSSSNADIHAFLLDQLEGIAKHFPSLMSSEWPQSTADRLTPYAAGVFQWARTAVGLLQGGDPELRLEEIVSKGLAGSSAREGSLHYLYSKVLEVCFDNPRPEEIQALRSILVSMALAREPLHGTDAELANFFSIREVTLQYVRRGLHSVIAPGTLSFNHKSFVDFLHSRACPPAYAIQEYQLSQLGDEISRRCLNTMLKGLCFNICQLETSGKKNADNSELEAKVSKHITPLLSYSCRLWADHLAPAVTANDPLMPMLISFAHQKLLFWIEVMSLLKEVNKLIPMLKIMLRRIDATKAQELSDFIEDTLRFIAAFSEPISESTPHIYVTALPFAPTQSLVTKHYLPHFPKTLAINTGKALSWSPIIFRTRVQRYMVCFAVSPDQKIIATQDDSGGLRLLDSETGTIVLQTRVRSWRGYDLGIARRIAFSPDGKRIVIRYSDYLTTRFTGAAVWDVTRGEICFVLQISPSEYNHHFTKLGVEIAYSRDGQHIYMWLGTPATFPGILLTSPTPRKHKAQILVWDAKTGARMPSVFDDEDPDAPSPGLGEFLAVSTQEGFLASSGLGGIRLWGLGNGSFLQLLPQSTDVEHFLAISEDGRYVVGHSQDGTNLIRIWSVDSGEILASIIAHSALSPDDWLMGVAYSHDTQLLVCVHVCQVTAWDVTSHQVVFKHKTEKPESASEWIFGFWLSRYSRKLLICRSDITMFHLGPALAQNNINYEDPSQPELPNPFVQMLRGKYQVESERSSDEPNHRRLLWYKPGKKGKNVPHVVTPFGSDIATSRDTTVAIIRPHKSSSQCYLWSTVTQGPLPMTILVEDFASLDDYCVVQPSPSHKLIAVNVGSILQVWCTRTGETRGPAFPTRVIDSLKRRVDFVAISPDDRMIAYPGIMTPVEIRDILTGELVNTPWFRDLNLYAQDRWKDVIFSSDGKRLLCEHDDRMIRVWDISDFSTGTKTWTSPRMIEDDFRLELNGWVVNRAGELAFYVPGERRKDLCWPSRHNIGVFKKAADGITECGLKFDLSNFKYGKSWSECYVGNGSLQAPTMVESHSAQASLSQRPGLQ
ncbi:hypothetical protein NP233_g6699 [Leucocoprinus birnbaumii]|uniref:Nephrocystin 3-like N-terminal domain-containing protein n=1 Tax=Leucocoprinus birnbaumii TaxID=56174 RepID=A0AAD5VW54_9AGAR|nr:hypothetical protein NP233_g6699 [Leucocoprinus birnbaumii]